jgi:hypothetical protein
MRTIAAFLALLIAATGCDQGGTTVHAANRDVAASVSRLRVRHLNWGDIVFGYLTIRGSAHTLISADLECFSLHVGSIKSESVWVDSLVDISRGDYPAQNGTVSVAVYWAMKDFKAASDADLRNATLSIDKPYRGSCFEFGTTDQRT